jgi:hypothetical protein
MQRSEFSIKISAPRKKVWDTLWNDQTYREWTSVFSEGSYAVSDWKEGSSIHFLSPDGGGMNSVIAELIPQEKMAFRHLGMIKDFKALPEDERSREWAGAMEIYTLKDDEGGTQLKVELDTTEKDKEYFVKTFPRAMEIVKEISER